MTGPTAVVADTHALVWYLDADERLSADARRAACPTPLIHPSPGRGPRCLSTYLDASALLKLYVEEPDSDVSEPLLVIDPRTGPRPDQAAGVPSRGDRPQPYPR